VPGVPSDQEEESNPERSKGPRMWAPGRCPRVMPISSRWARSAGESTVLQLVDAGPARTLLSSFGEHRRANHTVLFLLVPAGGRPDARTVTPSALMARTRVGPCAFAVNQPPHGPVTVVRGARPTTPLAEQAQDELVRRPV